MQLPVSLEYNLGADACLVDWASFGGPNTAKPFWLAIMHGWLWFAGLFLGLACAAVSGHDFAACLILVIIVWLVLALRRDAQTIPAQWRSRRIRLDISDDGITEHDEGVQAFMPWSSMLFWLRRDRFVLIRLRNHLAAIIADHDVNGQPIDLQEIANLLLERGVKERK